MGPYGVSEPRPGLLTHNKALEEAAGAAAPLQPQPSPALLYPVL